MKGWPRTVLWMLLAACEAAAGQGPAPRVTFNRDIAPIVYQHCAPCHHSGGIGPFPLVTYGDVRRHASQIARVTASRFMPPWPPEHGYGDFSEDRSLTAAQIDAFARWAQQGEPEGNAGDLKPAPHFSNDWQLGPPDLIVPMPQAYTMPADGTDVFRNFVLPTNLQQIRYVRALDLHFTNPRVIHHANVVLDRTQSLRRREGEDGQPGFPGMDVITEAAANSFDPDSHFLFWKLGAQLKPTPDSMSWRLDPGTDLVLNLHLQPTGKSESVQGEIGLYFAAHPPTEFPMLVQLEHDGAIDIPAGSRTFTVSDELNLPVDADVLAIYPHAHYLGKLIEAWATLPDGTRRWLIRIPNWDINWQAVYNYRQPVSLPKGTRLAMRITYDNSADNPRNPNHPPQRVLSGNRSRDEMGHVWLQLLPKAQGAAQEEARLDIQQAVMQRRLEKYPADFLAHYNLGALLQFRGKLSDAISSYQAALKVEPQSATAHNALGTALLLNQNVPESIEQFREALRIDATYVNARYNLARALAVSGDLSGSAAEYSSVLKDHPADAGAQAGLGTIYFLQHRYQDALPHFREAARLNPNDADTQTNLGAVFAMTGDLPSAKAAFEAALRIDPNHASARANLTRIEGELARSRQR